MRRRRRAQAAALLSGALITCTALAPPLDDLADERLSLHMAQHLLLTLLAAPLLCAGAPVALALRHTRGAVRAGLLRALRGRLVRALTHPLAAWSLFVATLLAWHLSPLAGAAVRHPPLHALEHLTLLATACLFWAPVLAADPLPRRHRLGPLGRAGYLLAAMPAMSLVGLVLVSDQTLRIAAYAAPARRLGIDALADQHAAGLVMWSGDLLLGLLTLALAISWLLAEERRALRRERHAAAGAAR